ncbi:hypothetical protein ACJ7VZ_06390 [Aeromonas salmonicida]|jgi:hypothetical protein|uniref:hypothetical protein n=1 Tax=Aeromonas salmonicida TaxID=645 RepID=UPI0038B7BAF0
MGKLTDQVLLQAIRDSIAIDACEWSIYNIVGDKKEIADGRFVNTFDTLVSSVCRRLKDYPASTVRARIKRISVESGFTLYQYRHGASIRVHTTKEHTDVLEVHAMKWWEAMGYCKGEARPTSPNHRLPESEAELLSFGGAA